MRGGALVSAGYSARTDALLELLPAALTDRELADLAIALADQAGLSLADQLRLSAALTHALELAADRAQALAAARSKP